MILDKDLGLYATHEVENQPPPLIDYNLFTSDRALQNVVQNYDAGWDEKDLTDLGAKVGSAEVIANGFLANKFVPEFNSHDRFGHRIDEVTYHPAYHAMMRLSVEAEAHALPWNRPQPGAHVARAARKFMIDQIEAGCGCPITMTFAVVPALRAQPEIADLWIPRATSTSYDERFLPAEEKSGCILGMAMTEKQGGSDVRANTTRAVAIGSGGPGTEYELTGHKWFCSAPMCDAFLTLAKTDAGLTCFLVPRWLPDGTKNRFYIQRLKDKLGNRSNASSEIEFNGTWAVMVGEEGRGVPTIIKMVNHTRLDCIIGSAALMRQAVAQATHHCAHRAAFGKALNQQPLMQNVLADLAVESEAAMALMGHIAATYDDTQNEERRLFSRLATAISKYWVCKRAPKFIYEAMECHGGAGYVEESPMPRLYRDAPVNSIWEGSGNVMCLDILRAMRREPGTIDAFIHEVEKGQGMDSRVDCAIEAMKTHLTQDDDLEFGARRLAEKMILVLQGSILVRHGNEDITEAFCASRLTGDYGDEYGTLPKGLKLDAIIERATPTM